MSFGILELITLHCVTLERLRQFVQFINGTTVTLLKEFLIGFNVFVQSPGNVSALVHKTVFETGSEKML